MQYKLNKGFDKKAQIGETMTWVVATLAIIAILLISLFVTEGLSISSKSQLSSLILAGEDENLIAVKSLSAFLNENSNLDLVKNFDQGENKLILEEKLSLFLDSLLIFPESAENFSSGWNFNIYKNDDRSPLFKVEKYKVIGWYNRYDIFFRFNRLEDEIKLRLWEENQNA